MEIYFNIVFITAVFGVTFAKIGKNSSWKIKKTNRTELPSDKRELRAVQIRDVKKESPLRKIRSSEDGLEEKYPQNKDRIEVRQTLDKLNLTSDLYNILQEDYLFCPMSSPCLTRPRLNFSQMLPYRPCCKECSCTEDCYKTGTCCADIETPKSSIDCIIPQYLPYGRSLVNNTIQIKMVTMCKHNFAGKDMKDLCERPNVGLKSIDKFLPVFASGNAYRNRFCALCNDVSISNIIPFRGQVACPNATGVYASSVSNLLQSLEEERRCNLLFYLPPQAMRFVTDLRCDIGFIRECNVTGKWRHYDPTVERACTSYTHIYRTMYRNVHCYMCNNEDTPFMKCSHRDLQPETGFTMGAFTAMLQFSSDVQNEDIESLDNNQCQQNEIKDVLRNVCVRPRCSIPFSFDGRTRTCSKVFEDRITVYELFLLVTSKASFRTDLVQPFITDYLSSGSSFHLMYQRLFEVDFKNSTISTHTIFHMLFRGNDSSQQIHHVLGTAEYLKKVFREITKAEILTGQAYSDFSNLSTYFFPYDGQRLREKNTSIDDLIPPSDFRDTLSNRVSRLLICPFITLENYTTILKKNTYELCVLELNVCFEQMEFRDTNGTYSVCIEKFVKRMNDLSLKTASTLSDRDDVEGVLSLASTCISVVSLLYVIVTFTLFSSLRTFPGKLILALSLSLLVAHLLYQFGLFQTDYPIVCKSLGILIHFFWLSVIYWMNVSCFHMVSVFTRTFAQELNTKSRFLSYTAYVYLSSFFFVIINVVTSHFRKAGLGYGALSVDFSIYMIMHDKQTEGVTGQWECLVLHGT
ncbi:uncharacterized protein LOC134278470 [Saccostrea cucullata]|uniref:uncharacterized protein LOC134278470 n=1 Tax=Saccostrea cuccullata TaxID=36930 RepID=UPI002ED30410